MVRLAGTGLNPVQAAFLRYSISLVLLMPLLYRYGLSVFHTRRVGLHAARGVVHGAGVLLWFYAFTRMPIAEATALSYTAPIFVTIGAAIFLREHVTFTTVVAVGAGFVGVLVILRPGFEIVGPGAIAILCSAPLFACSQLLAKKLVSEDSSTTIVLYLSMFATLSMAGPAIAVWETPGIEDIIFLTLAAAFATLSHILLARGLKYVDLSVVQPVQFLRLVWSALFGYVLFDEIPGIFVWVGSAIVVAGVSLAANRAARGPKSVREASP
jgi:drug/metabolite transporter (DMT)-like permease